MAATGLIQDRIPWRAHAMMLLLWGVACCWHKRQYSYCRYCWSYLSLLPSEYLVLPTDDYDCYSLVRTYVGGFFMSPDCHLLEELKNARAVDLEDVQWALSLLMNGKSRRPWFHTAPKNLKTVGCRLFCLLSAKIVFLKFACASPPIQFPLYLLRDTWKPLGSSSLWSCPEPHASRHLQCSIGYGQWQR